MIHTSSLQLDEPKFLHKNLDSNLCKTSKSETPNLPRQQSALSLNTIAQHQTILKKDGQNNVQGDTDAWIVGSANLNSYMSALLVRHEDT